MKRKKSTKPTAKKKSAAKRSGTKTRKMPEFSKPSERTLQAFERAIERLDSVERRTMFGYPSIFLSGNMLACVFQDRIMVRLSDLDRAEALDVDGATLFEPSPGRPMREYVDFPRSVVDDTESLAKWMHRGAGYVASLPPKTKRR